jgi:hypothetical protein
MDLDQIVSRLESKGLIDDLTEAILAQVPLDERLVFVEGHGLTDKVITSLTQRLENEAIVWLAKRLGANEKMHVYERTDAEI